MFEYASKGSLDTFFKSEQSRATLSSETRLQIMSDIICAIHYLHTGTKDNLGLFHRDIKSANICLDQNYTAKLIDYGLAKFVLVDDSNETSANSFSVQITSNGGVFGSRGYVCPRYSMGVYKFEASCDVYSFGIVMIELVTGCIQNDRTRLGNFSEHYFPSDFEGSANEALELAIPKLVKDVDPLAWEWDNGILSSVCSLAIRYIQLNMNYYSEQDFTLSFSCDGSESYSGRTLIIINYYIMCIITQIVVPITPKFVFVLTKFGKPGKHLGVPTSTSAMFAVEQSPEWT